MYMQKWLHVYAWKVYYKCYMYTKSLYKWLHVYEKSITSAWLHVYGKSDRNGYIYTKILLRYADAFLYNVSLIMLIIMTRYFTEAWQFLRPNRQDYCCCHDWCFHDLLVGQTCQAADTVLVVLVGQTCQAVDTVPVVTGWCDDRFVLLLGVMMDWLPSPS